MCNIITPCLLCKKILMLFLAIGMVFYMIIKWLFPHHDDPKPTISPNISDSALLTLVPVVMWHGMGDTCCLPFSLGHIKTIIQENTAGTYVHSLKIGGSFIKDWESGFLIHPNKQLDYACQAIKNDTNLANGYNAVGFSQGGQFLRALAQRCPDPPMRNLISIGGQHQGIFGLPQCPSLKRETCEYYRTLLNYGAYRSWVQNFLVQATYWHDPLNEKIYRNQSTFLNDINLQTTEPQPSQAKYAENLKKLKKFVMVKFLDDEIVQPKESSWFEFYKSGQDKEIVPFNQSDIFKNNVLGLKDMYNEGKLVFLETPGDHLKFTTEWFIQKIIPFLNE